MNEYAANHIRRVFSKLDFFGQYEIYTDNVRNFSKQPECAKATNDKQTGFVVFDEEYGYPYKRMDRMMWVDELINDIRIKKVSDFILSFEDVHIECCYKSDTKWIVEASFGYYDGYVDYEGNYMSTGSPSRVINCKRVPVQAKYLTAIS